MASGPTPQTWAAALLRRLGVHQSPGAVQAVVGWARAEGGHWNNDAAHNPLNTTQDAPGARSINGVGVKAYPSWQEGLDATVKTLRNGRYGGIVGALKAGDPGRVADAIGASPWGTSAGLARSAILGTRRVAGVHPFSGSGGASTSGSSSGASSPAVAVPQTTVPAPSAALTTALLAERAAPRSVGQLALPAFAAKPVLPQGAAVLGSTPAPARSDALAGALAQIRATQVEMPTVAVPSSAGSSSGGGGSSAPKGSGEVVVASTADRSGVGVKPIVKDFVRSVADHGGRTIEITTGTNHNRLTVNGRVSDHWDGHAADIGVPVDSKRGDVIAAHALQEAGVPWGQAIKMAQQGGLYTLTPDRGTYKGRRIQVIWKTYEGGNHHNHVHIGIR